MFLAGQCWMERLCSQKNNIMPYENLLEAVIDLTEAMVRFPAVQH